MNLVTNPRVPITVDKKVYVLAFDLAAIASLKEDFGLGLEAFMKLRQKPDVQLEDPRLLLKLVYAFTRSNDVPPTMKDVERMTPPEVYALHDALARAFEGGSSFGLKKESPAKASGTVSGSASIGGSRLTRRPTGSSSRRKRSGS